MRIRLASGFVRFFLPDYRGARADTIYDLNATLTPEPSVLMLLGTGMVRVLGVARRRFRRR